MSLLPIIDLAAFDHGNPADRANVAAAVDAACRDIGFLLIRGHGVPAESIARMHDVSADFFNQPIARKRQVEMPAHHDLGWKGQGNSYLAETLAAGADVTTAQDWKESFGMGPFRRPETVSRQEEAYFTGNIYPDMPAGFRTVYEAYYSQMEKLAATILRIAATGLGLSEQYFEDKTDRHISVLAVHHYPAQTFAPRQGQLRAGAHTDFGALTILHTGDNPGGLQVLDKAGEWLDVVPEPDQFVVNIGDLMARWTNDRWISTLHRVVNPPPSRAHLARQSITFFHQPNWHLPIECLPGCANPGAPYKYGPITSGAHLELKLARLRGIAA